LQISQIHKTNDLVISFELFPPKTPEGEAKLFEKTLPEFSKLDPGFLTCTYGAGGSTQEKTLEIVSQVKRDTGYEAAAHLTCVGASKRDISAFLEKAKSLNITNIVALRGDAPKDDDSFRPHPDGFHYANELVAFIKEQGGMDVAVAGYPEGHPECEDKYLDWERTAAKVEAGADVIITQLFYDNEEFFEFDDYLKNKLGVKVPIVPGVLPILSLQQIQKFCGMCGARLPERVVKRLESYGEDKQAQRQYGVELATEMCDGLLKYGIPGIHFYTLNRYGSTSQVMQNVGLLPQS
jgi:methylenetetrahydrofolate reductase (NADPH)